MGFPEMIQQLESYGVADVLLPFILVFTIVFAILTKTKILGDSEKNKNFNVIIALVMGLGVVIPHVLGKYPPGSDIVIIMNDALPNVSIILIAILMVMLIVGLFGKPLGLGDNPISGWVVMLAFIAVGFIFGSSAGWWGSPLGILDNMNEETLNLLVIILVFGIIIWFITKDDSKKVTEGGIGKLFSGLIKKD